MKSSVIRFVLILLLSPMLSLTTGCFSAKINSQTNQIVERKVASNSEEPAEADIPEYPAIDKLPFTLNERSITRISSQKDSEGYYLPPFSSVVIDSTGLDTEPKIGSEATVIPIGVAISPIELKILNKKLEKSSCEDKLEKYWEVNFETITNKEWLTAEAWKDRAEQYPFNVLVIYPANKKAVSLSREQLTKDSLPKGVQKEMIFAAIDTTNDKLPDFVIVHECKSGGDAVLDCEYTVRNIFVKDGQAWKVQRIEGC